MYIINCYDRRDKSRGYAWNKDKADSSKQSSVAPEMPDHMKLQLWTALTVLAAAFPNCDPVCTLVYSKLS